MQNLEPQPYENASGTAVIFNHPGESASGQVELEAGVYEVYVAMVGIGEENDAVAVTVGDQKGRAYIWDHRGLDESKPITITIAEKKTYPFRLDFAESGIVADRIIFRPLFNASVLADIQAAQKIL